MKSIHPEEWNSWPTLKNTYHGTVIPKRIQFKHLRWGMYTQLLLETTIEWRYYPGDYVQIQGFYRFC